MKYLLKLISIDTLIEFLVAYLASTVKNPESKEAVRLKHYVLKLHDAAEQFLVKTGTYIPR